MTVGMVIYSLECGHAAGAPATLVSGRLYCAHHETMVAINGVIIYEWRAKCDNCKFGRWAGTSKSNAELFANGHSRRYSSHYVYAEYTINPEARKTLQKFEAWCAG
jgi:hypothetical protein